MKTISQSSVMRSEYSANLALQSEDWRAALAPRKPARRSTQHVRALQSVRRPGRLPFPVGLIAAVWAGIVYFLE